MKCFVPEISWHNRDPVYSLDIQPKKDDSCGFYRLASGGADSHVVIWHVTLCPNSDSYQFASFECAADLQRHQKSVNVVRFSPNGLYLASGDDDGIIIIWKMRLDQDPPDLGGELSEKDKETWLTFKILRGHLQDIYDLAWSPDSIHLVSGSIDNTAVIWEAEKGKRLEILGDHKGFVQGVAWDPKGKYIATLSTDRVMRVFDANKRKIVTRCYKLKLPSSSSKEKDGEKGKEGKEEKEKMNKMFHSDTLKTFFRRLNFSPNGELLIAPCGIIESEGTTTDATYVFPRGIFNKPAVHLPSPGQYTVAVRSCPILFNLRRPKPWLALPYRVVFAVATRSTVVLYDSEQRQPCGFVSNIHYTGLTDITWSPDGRLIIVSSSEGFCSVIGFDENEIGTPYNKEVQQSKGQTAQGKQTDTKLDEHIETTTAIPHVKNSEKETTNGANNLEDSTRDELMEATSEAVCETKENISKDVAVDKRSAAGEAKVNPKADEVMEIDLVTPVKMQVKEDIKMTAVAALKLGSMTPQRAETFKTPDFSLMRSPMKIAEMGLSDSQCSELSLVLDCDESDLISKEEQARKLLSPYQGSPKRGSPSSKDTPKTENSSPKTPKTGRRVSLITLTSPKNRRKL